MMGGLEPICSMGRWVGGITVHIVVAVDIIASRMMGGPELVTSMGFWLGGFTFRKVETVEVTPS